MTRLPSWNAFQTLLDEWKRKIMIKGLDLYRDEKDIISIQAQCRMIAVIKTLGRRFKNVKSDGITGTDDPAVSISL